MSFRGQEHARFYVPLKQRVPNQYSVWPSFRVDSSFGWKGAITHLGTRFTEVRKMRGGSEGMEREDFDASTSVCSDSRESGCREKLEE